MNSILSGMKKCRSVLFVSLLLLIPSVSMADAASEAKDIISKAVDAAGGIVWEGINTMVVHESQARNTDTGLLQMELVHYMDTKGRGYRMEISSTQGRKIYGWGGQQFWASVDGKPGDEDEVKEAKRLISDAFFRFSLPYILNGPNAGMEYAGKDSVNGIETDSVKITYKGGPVDSYWSAGNSDAADHSAEKPVAMADHAAGHAGDKHEAKAEDHAKHGEAAGDHHAGNQIYFFHFDKDYRIVKIYFSHHGDDSYETFLFSDFVTIDGITREQARTLLREDGSKLYDTKFSQTGFKKETDNSLYKSPHH